ncbi:MAG TPA: DUF2309 domain-containing protein [Sandaracinaceae bacterium LLY-WYZ-13_1]|nr:DUF2309 domain-containing protein [Sandaracinaceae bacterium LLY-WYZ-13_1]
MTERSTDPRAALDAATRRVAPLYPLDAFVAVNPYLGLVDRPFAEVARRMAQVAGARSVMPRAFFADALADGRLSEADLADALAEAKARAGRADASLPRDVAALRATLEEDEPAATAPLPTVADVVGERLGRDVAALVVERISAWAGAHFDRSQAGWRSPGAELSPFASWRLEAAHDRTLELSGLPGVRAALRELPEDPMEVADAALRRLDVPAPGLELYLHRLLATVGGWAAFATWRRWEAELREGRDDAPLELLAIRLAFELAILEATGLEDAWAEAREAYAAPPDAGPAPVDLVLQAAYERAFQSRLRAQLDRAAEAPARTRAPDERPRVQAAFCIDVRSEVLRRALEAQADAVETIGFAGFFGFPFEMVPVGHTHGGAHCPALLAPEHVVAEMAGDDPLERAAARRHRRRRAARAWQAFKMGAVSCFSFVGPVGLAYARKLVTDAFGWTRPVPAPAGESLDRDARLRPTPSSLRIGERVAGLDHDARAAMAAGALRGMSLTRGFARVVALVGHGSTTVNNPHATGLDCGACGGRTGEANARVAAAVLNDPEVRRALADDEGIRIPDDTVFVAGLHDTTTDEVQLFDREAWADTHRDDLAVLEGWLAAASAATRGERAPRLRLDPGADPDRAIVARSRDWSQVRPEWGLAGCAAFVAAPRHRTAGLVLEGRSFLHSYDWRQDEGFGVLELIMTAPMVVASWISLQYYACTVEPRVFGSGNKVLHNVVGGLGVLEGNGGDLRVGLPWQSVHDGEALAHDPVRLSVLVEAPVEAMNDVIARHEHVRHLLDHGWLHLFALDDEGRVAHRYRGDLRWEPLLAPAAERSRAA